MAFLSALDLPIYLDKGQLQLREWLDFLAACGVFPAIFNLLISADGIWRWMGYLFPSGMIIVLVSVWHLMVKLNHMM